VGRYNRKRAQIRRGAQQPPWDFSPGLAHVLATVAEPRSDDTSPHVAFDALVIEHRRNLINEIDEVVASANQGSGAFGLGGQVEDVLDRAAERLMQVAREYGADEVTERLRRLEDERRFGVSDVDHTVDATDIALDITEIPRSTVSDRRVGLWR
jgi:hypothetical protein